MGLKAGSNRHDDTVWDLAISIVSATVVFSISSIMATWVMDIADYVDCSYETAYKKLRSLEDDGSVS